MPAPAWDREWLIADRFGREWRLWLTNAGDGIPGARPSRAELVGTDDAIAILVYQAFGGGGVDDPLLADALFALHEALKGTDLRGGVEGSSHAALDQVIASSLYEAVAAGRLAFEIVSPGPWPFADVPDDRPVLGPDDTPPDETSFVAVRLVDQTGAPLARRRFILGTPDRDERTGTTDGIGRARFDGVRPGSCSVVFDDFDVSDFREQVAQPGARSELEKGPVLCDAEGAVVTVGTGDTLASLAARSGFERFETLWNAPANAKLRSRRDNPMALLEGDQVAVPEKRRKTHHAATGTETKVVVFTGRLTLRIRLEDVLGQPRAGAPCAATADGATTTGATDGDGVFEIPITKTTRAVTLEADGRVFDLDVGALAPVDEPRGMEQRLTNLGYLVGAGVEDASSARELDDAEEGFRLGLELLQDESGQAPTGEPTSEITSTLLDRSGC